MNEPVIISICGDTCSECPRYQATLKNDAARLSELAILWHNIGYRITIPTAEEMKCTGCNKTKFCAFGINTCKHLEGKENCGQCDIFPCETISRVFDKADVSNERCKSLCGEDDYRQLHAAFMRKRENLARIHNDITSPRN